MSPALDLPRTAPHQPGCSVPLRRSRRAGKRALVLLLVHAAIAAHIAHWKLAGRTLTPVEPSEAGETLLTGAVNAGFVLLVLLLLSTLVLGRFFCGWACHVVAYQDACAWLLARLGLKPKPVRSRLLALVPVLAALEMFVLPSVRRLYSGERLPALAWHLTTDSFWERFPGPLVAALTFLVAGGALVWVLGAKGFCAYACPYGALFGIADRGARGRIRVTDACEGCGHCTATCTSNVRVHEEVARFGMVVDPGCMKCMDCVSVCPKGALYFGFGPLPSGRSARRRDFTWPEELLMAAVFLAGLYAFRDLYGRVPFLLALGLAVLAALAAVALVRLLRSGEMALQHLRLKRGNRFTPAGFAALALLPAYLGLTGHSALVQIHAREGDRLLARAAALPRGSGEWTSAIEASAEHLLEVERLGLVDSAEVESKLGQLLFFRGELDGAERALRRALELEPGNRSARAFLAEALTARGELDGACSVLEELFALDPRDPGLASALRDLLRRDPAHPRARALAERL